MYLWTEFQIFKPFFLNCLVFAVWAGKVQWDYVRVLSAPLLVRLFFSVGSVFVVYEFH